MSKKVTTESFIKKAKEIHGNTYDYSKSIYTFSKNKLIIICPKHGEFLQKANGHLNGKKYAKCLNKFNNGKEFIQYSNKVHNNFYSYKNVDFINTIIKVKIICPEHGEFEQTPYNHISGKGCAKCGNLKTSIGLLKNQNWFLVKANRIHDGKYDYSESYYTGIYNKIDIVCKLHGLFKQIPNTHLSGAGCPKCSKNHRWNTYDFVEECVNRKGNIYNYEEVLYKDSDTKIKIKCKEHGYFWQTPVTHLKSYGCPKCARNHRYTNEEFIEKVNIIHENKYDYSRVNYINSKVKIEIICESHGSFFQTPRGHIKGVGCPKCGQIISKPEMEVADFVKNLNLEILTSNRNIIKPYELDIYIPSLDKAIEFNGTYWHYNHTNKNCKPKGYHAHKSNLCREKGIRLLHIREDLWKKDKEKMKQIIIKFLNK